MQLKRKMKSFLLAAGVVFAVMCVGSTDVRADDLRIGRILTILEKMDSRFGRLEGRVGRLEGGGGFGGYMPSQQVDPVGYGGGFYQPQPMPYGGGGFNVQSVGYQSGGSYGGFPRVVPVDVGTGRPAFLMMLKHRR